MRALPERRAAGVPVRAAAARKIAAVAAKGRSLQSVIDEPDQLEARDRALLGALVSGCLRWHHRLDWQAQQLLSRPLATKEAELAALIRVGLFQLQWLRIPDHAAVAATVEAASAIGRKHAKSLVNAVLRRFLREREALERRMVDSRIATLSHPQWLIDAIEADWPDRAEEIFAANNTEAPMWLRVNQRHPDAPDYTRELEAAGLRFVTEPGLPNALRLLEPVPVAELPGWAAGRVSVQDGAAQYAAGLMALEPGQRVLDACAAPGGKTAHILESAPGLSRVVALDRDPDRLATVRANLDRLGLEAELVAADAARPDDWWDGESFDRILLDAPCTATGVIRRHPDIKLLRKAADVPAACRGQAHLLDALWPMLRKGGRLVYATCSVLRCENAAQVDAFLGRAGDAECRMDGALPLGQRLPGEANMDGFYYACIDRRPSPQAPRA